MQGEPSFLGHDIPVPRGTLLVAGLCALTVVGAVVFMGGIGNLEIQSNADAAIKARMRYEANEFRRSCGNLPEIVKVKCLQRSESELSQRRLSVKREYDELAAQQIASHWTSLMGFIAAFGLIISVFGMWLIWATFRESRRTADEAMKSASVAEQNRLDYINAERGHIVIPSAHAVELKDGVALIALNVKNIGTAVAHADGACLWTSQSPTCAGLVGNMTYVRLKLANLENSSVRVCVPYPQQPPYWVSGYIRYRTLGLIDCRTHFNLRVGWEDTPYGLELSSALETVGLLEDT